MTDVKLPRRQFLQLAAGAAALPALSRVARAQAYPTRPVRIVVGFAPGGGADIAARLIGQWLSERLGQSIIIENRPTANGNVAAEAVVRAPADGYTLLIVGANNVINTTLYENLNFNLIRDIVPVAGIIRQANIIVVSPSVPVKTVPEFIAHAKTNPGKINIASAGNGSTPHIAGELFKMMTSVHLVPVHYRGTGAALADLLSGEVQVMFGALPATIEYIKAGKLRALAVTTSTRSEALPDIPTVADFVTGYEASGWYGLGAPRNTSVEIVDKLNMEVNAALADPKIKARLADLGSVPMPMASAEFGKLIAEETEKWAKVVKFSGAKPE
jgi:tripartite-type tricarboxylate transporter receptor subunit TctC